MAPLSGIRVADFTRHLPGPFATDMLRRLGAEVFKIEPPEGDPIRWIPPRGHGEGALFELLNQGKQSVVVDLKTVPGREFAQRLCRACDVVVESYRPGVAREFGIDADSLRAHSPRLIHCAISGYGSQSARSGHDLNFTALSGLLDFQRDHQGHPTLPSSQLGDIGGALFAALLIVSAIHERDRTGVGRTLDVSLADAARAVIPTAEAAAAGGRQSPLGLVITGGLPNYEIYETADGGYLSVAPLEPRFWARFCDAIGHPELSGEEFHPSEWPRVRKVVAETIRSKSRGEWEAVFARVDACVEPLLTIDEARDRFGPTEHRHPLRVNIGEDQASVQPLGEAYLLAAAIAGYSEEDAERLRGTGAFRPASSLGRILTQAKRLLHI